MANEPNFIKSIDGKRDDSVNLRVGVPNQSIVDINNYGTEAVLTNTDTGETTQLTGTYHPELFGTKYDIPIELASERAKYILDIDGHAFSVYVTKRSIEHVLTDNGVFYFAGAASDGEGDEDMAFIINDVTGTLDKTWKEIKEAFLAGKTCIVIADDSNGLFNAITVNSISSIELGPSTYYVELVVSSLSDADSVVMKLYTTNSETGYPAIPTSSGNIT